MLLTVETSSLCREHVELENLRGEHIRMLDEAKKEKVPLLPTLDTLMEMTSFLISLFIFASSTSCC